MIYSFFIFCFKKAIGEKYDFAANGYHRSVLWHHTAKQVIMTCAYVLNTHLHTIALQMHVNVHVVV